MGLANKGHLGDEEIEQYVMVSNSDREIDRADTHLLLCEGCRERLIEADLYIAAMQMAGAQIRQKQYEKAPRKRLSAGMVTS